MEDDSARHDMRKLLKTFGIEADEAVIAHRARLARPRRLRIRLVLEDLTDYGASPPGEPLRLQVEGDVG